MNRRLHERIAAAEARVRRQPEPNPFDALDLETNRRLLRLFHAAEAEDAVRAGIDAVLADGGDWRRVAEKVVLP